MSAASTSAAMEGQATSLPNSCTATPPAMTHQHGMAGKFRKLQFNEALNGEYPVKNSENLKAPWSSLFKTNRLPFKGLKISKVEVDKTDDVCFSVEDLMPTNAVWKATLIGYIGGKFPGRQAIIDTCKGWNVHCVPYFHSSGWIVFKFDNDDDMHKILCNGPYLVFGRPILLKEVPPFFNFDDQSISLMPIWIKLPGLSLECWNATALGKLVSKIGNPIATDQLTAENASYSYARVLVEVDVAQPLKRSLMLHFPGGRCISQPIHYEFEPRFCQKCRRLGHVLESCRMGVEAKSNGNAVDGHPKRGRSRSRMRRRSSQTPKGPLRIDTVATTTADDVTKRPDADTSLPMNKCPQIDHAKLLADGFSLSGNNGPKINDATANVLTAGNPLPEKHSFQATGVVARVLTAGTSLPEKSVMQPIPAVALEAENTLYSDSENEGNVMNRLFGESLIEAANLRRTAKGKASVPTEAERRAALSVFFSDLAADEETFVEVKTKKKHKGAKKKGKESVTSSSQ